LHKTHPALVDGLDEILHFGIEDLDHMPGIGSAVCGSYHLVCHRHPKARKSESCQSARSETTTETGQRFSAHAGVGLAPHSRLDWTAHDVFGYLEERGFALHEAYTVYGSSRVSCCFCVLSSQRDLAAATRCAENQAVYWDLVGLEAASTFPFQQTRWLGDVAPQWLTEELRQAAIVAKAGARRREAAEAKIPQHLLYTEGWPRTIPTPAEASVLCDIRREVASAVGIHMGYTEPLEVIRRYGELLRGDA
jgi:hypothetical protein